MVVLVFDSGQSLLFAAPENQSGLLNELVQDRSLNMQNLRPAFGDLTSRSAYDQYDALLRTTPKSIRPFGPRIEAVRGMTLLTIKAIAVGPGLETGAFSFKFEDKQGFQIGDPSKAKRVDLEIFDVAGHRVELLLSTTKDKLSQPEINRILVSLHPVAVEEPVAPAASPD